MVGGGQSSRYFHPALPPWSVLTHGRALGKILSPVGLSFSKGKGGGHSPAPALQRQKRREEGWACGHGLGRKGTANHCARCPQARGLPAPPAPWPLQGWVRGAGEAPS